MNFSYAPQFFQIFQQHYTLYVASREQCPILFITNFNFIFFKQRLRTSWAHNKGTFYCLSDINIDPLFSWEKIIKNLSDILQNVSWDNSIEHMLPSCKFNSYIFCFSHPRKKCEWVEWFSTMSYLQTSLLNWGKEERAALPVKRLWCSTEASRENLHTKPIPTSYDRVMQLCHFKNKENLSVSIIQDMQNTSFVVIHTEI